MTYLKMCQIVNQSKTEVFYLETADGVVEYTCTPFPTEYDVEVIEFASKEAFEKREACINFYAEHVVLPQIPTHVRDEVYAQLLTKYPALVE